MARIGSTFTADQQFESFTRMPAFSSEFVPHMYALRTISEIAYAARGALFVSRLLGQSAHTLQSGPSLNAMNRRAGQDGKGPVKERSREEKAQGRKEQKEERPDCPDILARTDNWKRRFRQEILVPVKRLQPNKGYDEASVLRALMTIGMQST
jgi:hypothetical protein